MLPGRDGDPLDILVSQAGHSPMQVSSSAHSVASVGGEKIHILSWYIYL
jgi:hypothetical protein